MRWIALAPFLGPLHGLVVFLLTVEHIPDARAAVPDIDILLASVPKVAAIVLSGLVVITGVTILMEVGECAFPIGAWGLLVESPGGAAGLLDIAPAMRSKVNDVAFERFDVGFAERAEEGGVFGNGFFKHVATFVSLGEASDGVRASFGNFPRAFQILKRLVVIFLGPECIGEAEQQEGAWRFGEGLLDSFQLAAQQMDVGLHAGNQGPWIAEARGDAFFLDVLEICIVLADGLIGPAKGMVAERRLQQVGIREWSGLAEHDLAREPAFVALVMNANDETEFFDFILARNREVDLVRALLEIADQRAVGVDPCLVADGFKAQFVGVGRAGVVKLDGKPAVAIEVTPVFARGNLLPLRMVCFGDPVFGLAAVILILLETPGLELDLIVRKRVQRGLSELLSSVEKDAVQSTESLIRLVSLQAGKLGEAIELLARFHECLDDVRGCQRGGVV